MSPRECDNDDCDYETGVVDGEPKSWWVHVDGCVGLVQYEPITPEGVRPGSLADFLLNGPR